MEERLRVLTAELDAERVLKLSEKSVNLQGIFSKDFEIFKDRITKG